MRRNGLFRGTLVAIGLIGCGSADGLTGKADAQAIGFQPVITPVPTGAYLGVTPVVSADRRYVRLGVDAQFTGLRGVDTFSFGAGAVSGGGGFGGGFGGGGGLGGGNAGGGGGALGALPPNTKFDRENAIIPRAANRQLAQIAAVGGNNGTAVIPGLAAVGSNWTWSNPYFGYPTYGYGYGGYGGYAGYGGYGYGNPNAGFAYNPYPAYGYGYNPYGYGFNNYNQFAGPVFNSPPQTVNAIGDVMGAIIQSTGRR